MMFRHGAGGALPVAEQEELRRKALRHVRNSFTDHELLEELFPGVYPRIIVGGDGAYLEDSAGRRVLDCGNHLGACQIGHGRQEVAERMAQQAAAGEFFSLDMGTTNRPAAELGHRLAGMLPVDDPVLWFCSSGSEANEIAFKVARAFRRAIGEHGRTKILARDGSYHGSSYGALSATGMPAHREPFGPIAPGFVRVSQPSPSRCRLCDPSGACQMRCADDVERVILQEGPETITAMIAEPVAMMQAIKVPPDAYWPRIREICDRYGILLIADEVITGFGRTGTMFGLDRWGVQADIVTMAKGLTSGYAPLAAAAVSRTVSDALAGQALVHINTYAGHPVGCAAAMANLDVIEREALPARAAALEPLVRARLASLSAAVPIERPSVTGLLSSFELPSTHPLASKAGIEQLRHDCYERGAWVRAYHPGTVLFYPPLCVDENDVNLAFDILEASLTGTPLGSPGP